MLTMKNIIREGNANLKVVSKDVKLPLSDTDKKTLNQMMEFVKNSQDPDLSLKYKLRGAVGLAAPQINIPKRMFAVYCTDFDSINYELAMINPVIVSHSDEIIYLPGGEGCLSVDRASEGITPRYEWIEISGQMLDIPSQKVFPVLMRLSGYASIVFQHENDHLDGILFTAKMYPELEGAKPIYEACNIDTDPQ